MQRLSLSVALGDYDRTRALLDGSVRIDGVDPIFMTMSPDEHHQLLLASGRAPDSPSTVAQISFLLDDFGQLRAVDDLSFHIADIIIDSNFIFSTFL